MKLKRKIAFSFVLLALIPTVIGMMVIFTFTRQSLAKTADQLTSEYIGRVGEGLSAMFEGVGNVVLSTSHMPSIKNFEWNTAGPVLNQISNDVDYIKRFLLIEQDGSYWMSSNLTGNPYFNNKITSNNNSATANLTLLTNRVYFQTLVTQNRSGATRLSVTDVMLSTATGERQCIVGAAITDDRNSVTGMVGAVITNSEFGIIFSTLVSDFENMFGRDSALVMVSDSAQVVAWLQYSESAGVYTDSTAQYSELLYTSSLPEGFSGVVSSLKNEATGTTSYNRNGVPCLVAKYAIDNTPFSLYLSVPESVVYQTATVLLMQTIILIVVVSIVLFIGALIIGASIAKPVSRTAASLHDIANGNGDLTVRLEVRGKDEVADLGRYFNQFVENLHGIMQNISNRSTAMQEISNKLEEHTVHIQEDVSSIGNNISDLNFQTEEQSASVTETSATVQEITRNIGSLTDQIENQSAALTESSAAIQQMVSNINSISANLKKATDSFKNLKDSSVEGNQNINTVEELVTSVAGMSSHLLEANEVINSIASQTNLLAMNAAIEAAHAGDAGRGFSVVADEIRKLAEDSSQQSKAIASELQGIVSAIDNIVTASKKAGSSFDIVVSQIDDVGMLTDQISLAMQEQNEGSKQVLEALQSISDITVRVRDSATEMNSGSETILQEMNRVARISQQVQEMSRQVSRAVEDINNSVENISRESNDNKSAIGILYNITEGFKL